MPPAVIAAEREIAFVALQEALDRHRIDACSWRWRVSSGGAEVWCGWNREQIRMHKEWIEEHRSYRSALARFNAALAE